MKNPIQHPIQDALANRWSPYAFDPERPVSSDDLKALFEAARWTMSSYNAQPWRYIVGVRGSDDGVWQQVHDVLVDANKAWAKNAPVLALGLVVHNFEYNDQPNKGAIHDLGAASASLTFEATARGLCVHQMIGLDPDKARETFAVAAGIEPYTALAIGYAGGAEHLDADIAKRDERPRERKTLDELIIAGGL